MRRFTVHCLPFTPYLSARTRTGVRVAEGAGLENRYTRKGIVGSNPTLSVVPTSNPASESSFQAILTLQA
jgi:hypothetical protein